MRDVSWTVFASFIAEAPAPSYKRGQPHAAHDFDLSTCCIHLALYSSYQSIIPPSQQTRRTPTTPSQRPSSALGRIGRSTATTIVSPTGGPPTTFQLDTTLGHDDVHLGRRNFEYVLDTHPRSAIDQIEIADPESTETESQTSSIKGTTIKFATIQPIPDRTFVELSWYRWWVLQQLRNQPQRPLLCLPDIIDDDEVRASSFLAVWNHTRELVLAPGPKTIDTIASALHERGLLAREKNYEATQSAKDLVFSILGWQTMLYKPDFVSPDAKGVYKILDEMDGYQGETHACLTQAANASRKPLPDFLLGFGMMLPPPNYNTFVDDDEQKLYDECKTVSPKELNAYILKNICGLRFQWVDSLSCHLDINKRSGTIFLYRYPSFCLHHLQQHAQKSSQKCILHSCASEMRSSVPWGNQEDVTRLLEQVLLSYRLLFGQTKRSRDVFRSLTPFARVAAEGHDHFLSRLCSKKKPDYPVELQERDEYNLAEDFPHFRSKIVRLNSYASSKKPQSLRQLWADRRNSPAWLAFWSVLIFGSLGIFLTLIQTLFQILQYADAVSHSKKGE